MISTGLLAFAPKKPKKMKLSGLLSGSLMPNTKLDPALAAAPKLPPAPAVLSPKKARPKKKRVNLTMGGEL